MTNKQRVTWAAVLAGFMLCAAAGAQTAAPPQEDAAARAQREQRVRDAMKAIAEAKKSAAWKVGAPAQPLKVRWLKNEVPVNFNDGKVRVIEFWATWCGPCRRNMPHMSEVARKYRGTVDVISINVWENAHSEDKDAPYEKDVINFVNHAGDMMDHPVAMDTRDGFMGKNWMTASGSMGIPMAFIIDKHGKYAWSAPAFEGLEEAIDLALADKLDAAGIEKVAQDYKAGFARQRELRNEAQGALTAGKPDEAIRLANEAAAALPVFANSSWPVLYNAHKAKGAAEANAFVDRLAREHSTAPLDLRQLAMSIINEDTPSAIKLLRAGANHSRAYDPIAIDLARAYARSGDYANALAIEEKVVAGLKDLDTEASRRTLEAQTPALEEYRQKAGQKTS